MYTDIDNQSIRSNCTRLLARHRSVSSVIPIDYNNTFDNSLFNNNNSNNNGYLSPPVFKEHKMFEKAKYKTDPDVHFPISEVLRCVKNWDPSYDAKDVESTYHHWCERRANIDRINSKISQEKALVRKFQEPHDAQDDDANIAFRPRTSDDRVIHTRRQTKKPKRNNMNHILDYLNQLKHYKMF